MRGFIGGKHVSIIGIVSNLHINLSNNLETVIFESQEKIQCTALN